MRTLILIILIYFIFIFTSFANTVSNKLPDESVKKEKNIISNQSDVQLYDSEIIEPGNYILSQNYPNPFNPATTISYTIPKMGSVTLKVYNLIGVEVAVLVDEDQAPGDYQVEFITGDGSAFDNGNYQNLPSGIYFYRLESGDYSRTMKMNLIK
jgi:hypothetical protein